MRFLAENFGIGMKGDPRACGLGRGGAAILKFGLRLAARIKLAIKHLVAHDLDFEMVGQGIHDRQADAVQAARCLIGAAGEFAARMQRGQNDLEG